MADMFRNGLQIPQAGDFDPLKGKNHIQTKTTICGRVIEIDDEIVDLISKINAGQTYPLTTMSCQYNRWGYIGITFDISGFLFWMKTLEERHVEKYKYDPNVTGRQEYEYHDDCIFCAITMNNPEYDFGTICTFKMDASVFCGSNKYECSVTVLLHPKHKKQFMEKYDALFSD